MLVSEEGNAYDGETSPQAESAWQTETETASCRDIVKKVGRAALDQQSEQGLHPDNCAEQRHLVDELQVSEQRFRITFEQAPVGMAQVGLDGCWLLVNQKLCALLGYTQDELLERTFHAVMLPEDLPTAFAHDQYMITGEIRTYQQELRFVRKDGSQIWVNLTVTLVRDCVGMPLYFLAVIEDRPIASKLSNSAGSINSKINSSST